jgi:hypothetical protein
VICMGLLDGSTSATRHQQADPYPVREPDMYTRLEREHRTERAEGVTLSALC